jgi:KaiC/GvpD/RAD55 family RecA-like ATPase
MWIEIKKNKALNLDIPEFNCDCGLADHLTKYDMLKHLNAYTFDIYCGKPGSGKTSLMVSFLSGKGDKQVYRKVFNNVVVIMPQTSIQSMKKNVFKKHDQSKMYEELDLETIQNIYKNLEDASSEKENTLLIMDDIGASLKNNEIQKIFRKIIYNRRHLKVKVVILVQSFLSLPKEIRKLLNNIFLFKPSKVEFENLFDELFETNKDLAIDIMNIGYEKPHDYLMLNVDTQRIYKGFDEIIITK